MELKGKVKVVFETTQVSEKFSKRDVVIEDNSGMYPQVLSIQFTQDKCALLDGINVGDEVTISINLKGREWTSPQGEVKYFNSIEGWKIQRGAAAPSSAPASQEDMPF